jgi:hypothetical protein
MTGGMPAGRARRGRLVFPDGASRLRLAAGEPGAGLYGVWPAPRGPRVRAGGDLVVVRFPRHHPAGQRLGSPEGPAGVTLSAVVRWEIALRGPVTYAAVDLHGLALTRLDLDGGAVRVTVILPVPQGTVGVRILGGASHVAIHRPPGVPVRLRIDGGATGVAVDDQGVGVAGGQLSLHAPGDGRITGCYEIAVAGGRIVPTASLRARSAASAVRGTPRPPGTASCENPPAWGRQAAPGVTVTR